MLGSDNVIHAISNNTQNKIIPTVEYDNKRYRHAYIVKLPKTIDGFMISIRKDLDDSPLLDEYTYVLPGIKGIRVILCFGQRI